MSKGTKRSVWAKVRIMKRTSNTSRTSFGLSRTKKRYDGREEYIIKIPGFSGELRKYMTQEEALAWLEESNKSAFMSAAQASKGGLYGVESFNKYGHGRSGAGSIIAGMAAKAFSDKKGDD